MMYCKSRKPLYETKSGRVLNLLKSLHQLGCCRRVFPLFALLLGCLTWIHDTKADQNPRLFKDCETCPTMVSVPPGTFVMGTDIARPQEGPRVRVNLGYRFAIARTETTWQQYQPCVDAGKCPAPITDRGWGRGTRPVIYITYGSAQAYAAWLSRVTGKPYRLPTEIEWEYAARGGRSGRITGKGIANCHGCIETWSHKTFPVASMPANGFGLYDMLGNVFEWTQDCWTPNHAMRDAQDCTKRVRKGGSWYMRDIVATPTYRHGGNPDRPAYDIGFRVAITLPQ